MNSGSDSNSAPQVVLDTNIVLDWLVFRDPGISALAAAITDGKVTWLACATMRDEIAHMLGHHSLARWQHDPATALATFDAYARLRNSPQAAQVNPLCCSDPDDQVFIDLAVSQQARWLFTHDRALLKLARRARVHGVSILRPAEWRLSPTADAKKKSGPQAAP